MAYGEKTLYVDTKGLPDSLKNVLHEIGYNKRDIAIVAKEKTRLSNPPCFECNRGFSAIIDLANNTYKLEYGSWGGANPFEHKAVDNDKKEYELKPGIAVITGESGGKGPFAKIILHPDNLMKFLPEKRELTEAQIWAVNIFSEIKASYRKQYLAGHSVTDADIDECVRLGYLSRKGNGLQITTLGKNIREENQRSIY
jgi:hypothetical protein